MRFHDLRKNLKKDTDGMRKVKMAVVADWSVQMLCQAIRGFAYTKGLNVQIYEGSYDQMESELLDPTSSLYAFEPDYILVFPCAEKLREKFFHTSEDLRPSLAQKEAHRIKMLCESAGSNSSAKIILSNYCEIHDGIYGNHAALVQASFTNIQREVNQKICQFAAGDSRVFLLDISALQGIYGRQSMHDPRLYYASKTVFAIDFLPVLAEQIIKIVNVILGSVKKCIITDLDNTLWGGVIGDDGLEGIQIGSYGLGMVYSDLQAWIKEHAKRGVAVAVCSKNNEDTAKEPFEKHQEMVLRLEDISVFVANWDDKATNIKRIQKILNIGFDSMVFLDDNPFERELVRTMLPEVTVPELPEDPAEYLTYLQQLALFETVYVSDEDKNRTRLYRQEADRLQLEQQVSSIDEYLESLQLRATARPFDGYSIPRAAQLSQRSNQFNLRTKRYTEQDLEFFAQHPEKFVTFTVSLKDKFGEYGIISVVILEKRDDKTLFLDTLFMSCRVLKRSVEEYVFNKMVKFAAEQGIETILGEYLPTKKNAMVKDLLGKYGFEEYAADENGTSWKLDVACYTQNKTFVEDEV